MKKKILVSMLCVTMVFGMISGCGVSSKEKKATDEGIDGKKITVACEATTPGWIQTDENGKLSGYDYDVWQEIGKRTGYSIDYKVMEWDGMWSMLDSERIDSVGEQISVTEERKEKYNFSEPYAYNYYCLLSAADNDNLKSMNDLKTGMTISCETNTSDELIVNGIDEQYNVKLERTYYDGMSVQDVTLGRCDLWPRAETSCILTVKEVENLKILGKTDMIETNAYPFPKTERGEKLNKLVSKAIEEMRQDGTLTELSKKWFDMDISESKE
ncbi:MAG: transporter substrate-binding domain-containing protein [Lachnospiraceae bacterium]